MRPTSMIRKTVRVSPRPKGEPGDQVHPLVHETNVRRSRDEIIGVIDGPRVRL
jgi:hypothetical protein